MRPMYRLYKYKEAFSADLIEYLVSRYAVKSPVLDCFAGAGTTLFSCADLGLSADGVEILPVGKICFEGRQELRRASKKTINALQPWKSRVMWEKFPASQLNTLRISANAYPPQTVVDIGKFMNALMHASPSIQKILRFALICVLESVSYTRKDGQFLRWDNRSGRNLKSIFNKGHIAPFASAISQKIEDMTKDSAGAEGIFASPNNNNDAKCNLYAGSCLDIMPSLPSGKYNTVITSPPYCNRYDYTRTYALELALLGTTEAQLSALRQSMISCTVENKRKNLFGFNKQWESAARIAEINPLLIEITEYLKKMKELKALNNGGIPRMVEEYFREMACVIWECWRVLAPGGKMIMVNDNVRYGGIDISVDLILSDIAKQIGFDVAEILVLPRGKGNSSQQMGKFGRSELRKCVYCWEKT